MGQGGEGETARVAHICVEVAAGDLAQGADQLEQAPVGAVLEQDAVPLVLQLQAAMGIAAGLLEPAVDLPQALEALRGWGRGEPQGERLERAEDRTDLPDFGGIEPTDPEPPSLAGFQHPFADQPEERFADRGPADAELGGEGDIAHAGAGGQVAALDALEYLAIDLIAERDSRDHGRS